MSAPRVRTGFRDPRAPGNTLPRLLNVRCQMGAVGILLYGSAGSTTQDPAYGGSKLLIPQDDGRVDAHGAHRRDTGRNNGNEARAAVTMMSVGGSVGDTLYKMADIACATPRATTRTCRQSSTNSQHHAADHRPNDMWASRAKSEPDSDFLRSFTNRECDDCIQPERGQDQRRDTESREHTGAHARHEQLRDRYSRRWSGVA